MERTFVHPRLGEEVRAVSGSYSFSSEETLVVDHRLLVYLVGSASVDTSCCGVGGCGYALVVGFAVEQKVDTDPQGRPVSLVEPVSDPEMRRRITTLIKDKDLVQEVQFWSTEQEVP